MTFRASGGMSVASGTGLARVQSPFHTNRTDSQAGTSCGNPLARENVIGTVVRLCTVIADSTGPHAISEIEANTTTGTNVEPRARACGTFTDSKSRISATRRTNNLMLLESKRSEPPGNALAVRLSKIARVAVLGGSPSDLISVYGAAPDVFRVNFSGQITRLMGVARRVGPQPQIPRSVGRTKPIASCGHGALLPMPY